MKQEYLIKARRFAEKLAAQSGAISEEHDETSQPGVDKAAAGHEVTPDVGRTAPSGSHGPVSGRVSVYTITPWPTKAEIEQAVADWQAMRASSILAGMPE